MPVLIGGFVLTLLVLLISFGFLTVKYFPSNWIELLKTIDWMYIGAAFILFFLYYSFDALRLKTIAKGYKINYSLFYAYMMSFIATFGATITPAHLGGEFIIFYTLKRLGVKNHKIWGTILFKTVSGMAFFILAFPIFIIYTISNKIVLKKVLILSGIFAIFTLISIPILKFFRVKALNYALNKKLKLYCIAVIYFWKRKKLLFIKACIYSILLYLTLLSFAPVLLKAFHVNISILQIYLLQLPLIYAIFTSPTPGGSGVGELGGVAIFSDLLPPERLGIFIALWRFFSQYLGATLGGLLFTYILWNDIRKKIPRGKDYF
jgi:uncharacterized protein (TIRG00374 family)